MMITEYEEYYEVALIGFTVECCVVDFAFTLQFRRNQEEASLRLECPFSYEREGSLQKFNPETERSELGPALELFKKEVISVTITKSGLLSITFDDSTALKASSNNGMYEAWTLNGPGGLLIVGGPGDHITLF